MHIDARVSIKMAEEAKKQSPRKRIKKKPKVRKVIKQRNKIAYG